MSTEFESNTASRMTDAEKAHAEGYPSVKAYRRAMRGLPERQAKVVDTLTPEMPLARRPPRPTATRVFPWLFFGLPMLLMALYLSGFAADRYVAESKIFVTHVAPAETGEASIGNMLTSGYARASEDLPYLKEYILSLDMLLKLDQGLDLHRAFGATGRDFWYRLPKDATQEAFLAYYRSRVEVLIDSNASILTVITEGFTPEGARDLNQMILAECDKFINRLSQEMANEHLVFAKDAVEHSRTELKSARIALLNLQNRYGTLDPVAQADAASRVIAELEAKGVQLQAELRQARTYLSEDTPQVITTKSNIEALEAQIVLERSKLAGTSDEKMSKVMVQYLDAKAQVDFSADMYRLSLTALEGARAEAIRKLKSIAVIVRPQPPEEPGRPRKLMILGTLLLVLMLLYGLVKLVWAVVEDHREDA